MKITGTDLGELFPLVLGTVSANRWVENGADRVFDTFLDHGGNVIDTARVYTLVADSEPIIGKWLKNTKKRHDVMIIGKGGHPDIYPVMDLHKPRLGADSMRSDIEKSLTDLGTDYIDIYLYHRDDTNRPVEELIGTMEAFVKEGKIRYYGISNWTLPRMKEAQSYCEKMGLRGFVMNQSLINIGSEHSLMPKDDTLIKIDRQMQSYHKEIAGSNHDILAAGFMSNCGGFFQQYISGGAKMVRDETYLTEGNIEIARDIERRCKENNTTVTQEVLSFYKTLDFPCMALFGPRDPEGIIEALSVFHS